MIKYNLSNNITPKAKNLLNLKRIGIKVPNFFTLTFSLKELKNISKNETDIFNNYLKLYINSKYVIVRITADIEDNYNASFAGLFYSKVYLRNSLFLENILEDLDKINYNNIKKYKKNMSLDNESIEKFTVIIQDFIIGDISGIAFTKNPVTNVDEYVIESNFGLNNTLTDGRVTPDTYYISKYNNGINKIIGSKKKIAVLKKTKIIYEENFKKCETLNEDQIRNLIHIFKKIEGEYKKSQDIEWTISDGEIYILQTRPITTIREE